MAETNPQPQDLHVQAWQRIHSVLGRMTGNVPHTVVEEALAVLRAELVALLFPEDSPLRIVDDRDRFRALEKGYEEVLGEIDAVIDRVAVMSDGITEPIGADLGSIRRGLQRLEDEGDALIRGVA